MPKKEKEKGTVFREFFGKPKDVNEEERSFSHRISDESIDAHGSIIKLSGWDLERMEKGGIPVLFSHDHGSPIGRSEKIYRKSKALWSRSVFAGDEQRNELAETMWRMAVDGFIRSWSVGFNPIKWKLRDDIPEEELWKLWDPYVYTKQELLEYSLVPVPSNPNAITQARTAGINVTPFLDIISANRVLVTKLTEEGVAIPSINDSVSARTSLEAAEVPDVSEPRSPEVEESEESVREEPDAPEHPVRLAAQKKLDQIYGPGRND